MRSQTQRSLLLAFIGSILCCGLAGVFCLIFGRFGWLEGRVLGSTAAIGGASILALASVVPLERRRWVPVAHGALTSVCIALVLVLIAIWWTGSNRVWFLKTLGLSCTTAIAFPHVGLLSLARLKRSYEWVRVATVVAVAVLAGQIWLSVLGEIGDDTWFRLMGVVAIADVCGTIAVPILHRVSAIQVRENIRTVDLELSLTCPRCNRTQRLPVGRSRCVQCKLSFSIAIEEAHCHKCGYPLYGLTSAVCPECGTPIAVAESDSQETST